MSSTINTRLSFISALLLLLLSSCISLCAGHGQMCEPRQRGAYKSASRRCLYDKDIGKSNVVTDFCPHCLSGGGVGTVARNLPPNGWAVYDPIKDITTAQRASLCGDARGGTNHLLGGRFVPPSYENVPIVNVSQTGGTIDFVMQLDTNHNGYFDFFLCNLDACGTPDIEESCFVNGHCHKLQRVAEPTCEDPASNTQHFCSPIDPVYPGRWYIPCRQSRLVVGGDNGIMRYKLPDGVTCAHCVLQWYWGTANSCNPAGLKSYFIRHAANLEAMCNAIDGGPVAHSPRLGKCGGSKVPEEFWSCGDMQISVDGSSLGQVPIVELTPSPSSLPSATPLSATIPSNPSGVPTASVSVSFGVALTESPSLQPSASLNILNDDPSASPTVPVSVSLPPSASVSPLVGAGNCVANGDVCNGDIPCCAVEHVCVHTVDSGGFNCIAWYKLWKEVSDQRKIRG